MSVSGAGAGAEQKSQTYSADLAPVAEAPILLWLLV